jgi:hypothetical protein
MVEVTKNYTIKIINEEEIDINWEELTKIKSWIKFSWIKIKKFVK